MLHYRKLVVNKLIKLLYLIRLTVETPERHHYDNHMFFFSLFSSFSESMRRKIGFGKSIKSFYVLGPKHFIAISPFLEFEITCLCHSKKIDAMDLKFCSILSILLIYLKFWAPKILIKKFKISGEILIKSS